MYSAISKRAESGRRVSSSSSHIQHAVYVQPCKMCLLCIHLKVSTFYHQVTQQSTARVSLLCSSHSNLPRPPGSPLMIITHTGHYVRLLSPRRPLPLLLLQGQLFSSQELPCISFNLILARESTSFYFSKSFIQLLSLLQKETLEPWKCQL